MHVSKHMYNIGMVVFWQVNNFIFSEPDALFKFAEFAAARGVLENIQGLYLHIDIFGYDSVDKWMEAVPEITTRFPSLKRVIVCFSD